MLIGIDASRATKEQKTGTEYYSEEIIYWLSRIDKKNKYVLYSPIEPKGKLAELPKNFSWKIMPFPKLWSQIRLSVELVFGSPKPDVIFEPAHTIPFIHPKNIVVTLHDLGFKYFPELYTPLERKYHNFCMDFSARKAKKIIAPSQYTKDDLLKTYKINPDKITVIHHGYNQEIYRPVKPMEINPKIQKYAPYIFFIGRLEKKKNLLGILKTYQLLRKEQKIKHKLVLAGKRGYGYEEFDEEKNRLSKNIQNDIIELGYTPEDELSLWMKNADIFFFPTFFEGFGLPVIEAMACNVPVVASNNTSIPEITGSSALLINPHKPLEMAAALSKIINSQALKKSLQSKGLVRASMFSWEKAANKTLRVLENIN
ncbi:MAG: glycosyltransferase family 4 protein [Patescibacteria group bacterium]|nr:glycosyltransferase family 4 protein [Patescibacteria group bacterium]